MKLLAQSSESSRATNGADPTPTVEAAETNTLCPIPSVGRLKSSMPLKRDLALQNIPPSKQPSKMQPQIEDEDVT